MLGGFAQLIGGKLKKQLLLAILIGLGSCTPAVTPSVAPTTVLFSTSIPTETFLPTAIFTTTPSRTPTPTELSITKTATPIPTPFTYFGEISVSRIDHSGMGIVGGLDDIFHTFTEQPDGLAAVRFTTQIAANHFINGKPTPTPTPIPTDTWRVVVYRYRTDGMYINQHFVDANFKTDVMSYPNRLVIYLSADVSIEAIQTKFGDCSAFAYQVLNEQGKVQQQGNFAFNPHPLFASGGGLMGNIHDGITVGFPYSLNEKETEFFHEGKFITIHELKSGFYRLSYLFNLTEATGVSATVEQEKVANELTIRFFPYQEEGNYFDRDAYLADGTLIHTAGIYQVHLPIDYLRNNTNSNNNKYYLRVLDGSGKIVREEYFVFIPYTQ